MKESEIAHFSVQIPARENILAECAPLGGGEKISFLKFWVRNKLQRQKKIFGVFCCLRIFPLCTSLAREWSNGREGRGPHHVLIRYKVKEKQTPLVLSESEGKKLTPVCQFKFLGRYMPLV